MTRTTNQLLEDIKSDALVPITQYTLNDDDLVRYLNNQTANYLMSRVRTYGQGFGTVVDTIDVPAGRSAVRIPSRAFGGMIENLEIVRGHRTHTLTATTRKAAEHFQGQCYDRGYDVDPHYYVENNNIQLVPAPTSAIQLRLTYQLRPGTLVLEDETRRIITTNTTQNTLRIAYDIDWLQVGVRVDVVSAEWATQLAVINATVTAWDRRSSTVTLDRSVADVVAGDWLVRAGESATPQVQEELVPILVKRVVRELYAAVGDDQGKANADQAVAEMETDLQLLNRRRIKGAVTKMVNRTSGLRNGGGKATPWSM